MKIRTHYLIAKIAIKDNKKLNKFHKLIFCIGSLLPDLTPIEPLTTKVARFLGRVQTY